MTCSRGTELRRTLALSLVRTDAGAAQAQRDLQGALRTHEARCPACGHFPTLADALRGRSISQVVSTEFPKDGGLDGR